MLAGLVDDARDHLRLEENPGNVLATPGHANDPAIREGVKAYSQWPTIPQLYIDGEFQGGCDIVREMYASGELQEKLGVRK